MNYNEYSNPKATKASKILATATYLLALIGIIAAVMVIASGVHSLWGLLIILAVLAIVLLRPRIEGMIVAGIIKKDGQNMQ